MTAIYAHRGCTLNALENTLEAFTAAVELGCDGVELDVHRTSDGAIVVHHDAVMSDGRAIANTRCADLPPFVPTLEEVLEVLGSLRCNVELKVDPDDPNVDPTAAFAAAVLGVVEQSGATDRVIYSSFHRPTIERVVALDPTVQVGWLLNPGTDLAEAVLAARAAGFSALHPFVWSVTEDALELAHDAGLEINTWTVNGPDDLKRMVGLGVDCIITDRPDWGLLAVKMESFGD